jgi:tetratricopeptide (TPR) repeat protein
MLDESTGFDEIQLKSLETIGAGETVLRRPDRSLGLGLGWSEALASLPSRRSISFSAGGFEDLTIPPDSDRPGGDSERFIAADGSKRTTSAASIPPSQGGEDAANASFGGDSSADGTPIESAASPSTGGSTAPRGVFMADSIRGEDYTLLRKIGEGGMGEVWQAWQTSLARMVAVKRLKSGAIEDFLQEAYTSAELDHPNIVPVHDMGRAATTATGEEVPLMAMKLVRGQPWGERMRDERRAADFNRETFLARNLRVLLDVCNAVAFAHAKGIIHRDLKPQQVMVGEYGEVYLMDWGLALLMRDEAPLAARDGLPKHQTLATATNPCGSPAYMAPEQTAATTARLGYHTDVYLLGSTLFEIVAGAPPHYSNSAREALFKASVNEINELPRSCPPELKTLLERTLAATPEKRTKSVVAFRDALDDYLTGAGRRAESVKMAEGAERDLAAAKGDYAKLSAAQAELDRARSLWPGNPRVEPLTRLALEAHARSALAARDLTLARLQAERLPDDEARREILGAVESAEAGALAHARQRRIAVGASFALLGVILVGGGLLSWRVMQERDEAQRQRDDATIARQEAVVERDAARGARGDAENLLDFMTTDLRDRLKKLGRVELLDAAADRAREYWAKQDRSRMSPEEHHRLGRGLIGLGNVYAVLGDLETSLAVFEDALVKAREVWRDYPENLRAGAQLLNILREYAVTCNEAGDLDRAIELAKESVELSRTLQSMAANPDPYIFLEATCRGTLGGAYLYRGNATEAIEELKGALAILDEALAKKDDQVLVLNSAMRMQSSLADMLIARGAYEEGVASMEKGLVRARRLVELDAEDDENFHGLAVLLLKSASFSDRYDEALASSREAIEILKRLRDEDPTNVNYGDYLGKGTGFLGDLYFHHGELQSAERCYQESLEHMALVAARDPLRVDYKRSLSISWEKLGNVRYNSGKLQEALECYEKALATTRELAALDPENAMWLADLGIGLNKVGDALLDLGRADEALASYEETDRLLAQLAEFDPENASWHRSRASTWERLANVQIARGQLDEASDLYARMQELRRELSRTDPGNPQRWSDLASGESALAQLRLRQGRNEESFAHWRGGDRLRRSASRRVASQPGERPLRRVDARPVGGSADGRRPARRGARAGGRVGQGGGRRRPRLSKGGRAGDLPGDGPRGQGARHEQRRRRLAVGSRRQRLAAESGGSGRRRFRVGTAFQRSRSLR